MTVFEDFTAGIATQAPRLVATHSKKYAGLRGAKTALNVVLDETGVRTAPGYTRNHTNSMPAAIRGLHWYDKLGVGPVSELLAVAGGQLYKDNTILWTSVGTGLTDTPKARMITYNGYTLIATGSDPIQQFDGTSMAAVDFNDGATPTPNPVTDIFPADAYPSFMFEHLNRIFYLGSTNYPYRFWTPDSGTHNIFGDNSEAEDVGIANGLPLIAGASMTKGFAILFTTGSTWVLSGSNPVDSTVNPFALAEYSTEVGCIAPDTVINVGPDVYFLSNRGYKCLKYVAVTGNITDADPFYPAKPILDTIDKARVSEASACFNAIERCIYLSIPVSGGGWTTLVYNIVTQGIMQRDGFNIANQIYRNATDTHYFSRFEATGTTAFRVMINGVTNTYDGVPFASSWESLLVGTEQMGMRKFFHHFLAYTKLYNGSSVQCGVRLVNVDGEITTKILDFGDVTGTDNWDIGLWDEALWDNALGSILRYTRIGRGVAISIFFNASAGAAFFFDRLEFDEEARGLARR